MHQDVVAFCIVVEEAFGQSQLYSQYDRPSLIGHSVHTQKAITKISKEKQARRRRRILYLDHACSFEDQARGMNERREFERISDGKDRLQLVSSNH